MQLGNILMLKPVIKTVLLFPLRACHIAFRLYDSALSIILPRLRGVGRQQLINYIDNDIKLTKHGSAKFQLYTPNQICNFRYSTFSNKESSETKTLSKLISPVTDALKLNFPAIFLVSRPFNPLSRINPLILFSWY